MSGKELIDMAKEVPYQYWWNIEVLIDSAKDDMTAETLRWIMKEKELLEQYNNHH